MTDPPGENPITPYPSAPPTPRPTHEAGVEETDSPTPRPTMAPVEPLSLPPAPPPPTPVPTRPFMTDPPGENPITPYPSAPPTPRPTHEARVEETDSPTPRPTSAPTITLPHLTPTPPPTLNPTRALITDPPGDNPFTPSPTPDCVDMSHGHESAECTSARTHYKSNPSNVDTICTAHMVTHCPSPADVSVAR